MGNILMKDRIVLSSLTHACRLKNDRVRTRLPIRRGLLSLILDIIPKIIGENQEYLIILYRAMFVTAYFGLFRIGEITSSQHTITVGNVHVGVNKNKLMFVLHTSKTHGLDKKPQIVKISALPVDTCVTNFVAKDIQLICPFQAVHLYVANLRSRRNDDEPFFIFRDRSPVSGNNLRKVLKDAIKYLGLNQSLYTVHGIRAGRASDLFSLQVSVETIRKLGRWSSSAIYEYFRH